MWLASLHCIIEGSNLGSNISYEAGGLFTIIPYCRTTSTHVHYYPLPPPHQLKSVFVLHNFSDVKSAKSTFKNDASKIPQEFSLQSKVGLKTNNLYFDDEIEDFDLQEDFILI